MPWGRQSVRSDCGGATKVGAGQVVGGQVEGMPRVWEGSLTPSHQEQCGRKWPPGRGGLWIPTWGKGQQML